MILDDNKFKPIRTFGLFLTAAGIFGIFALIAEFSAPKFDRGGIIFLIIMSGWHLISGLGILLRKNWGFILMKLYLYIMYLGVPLGTLLAKKILSYIKENEIELFFKGKEIRL